MVRCVTKHDLDRAREQVEELKKSYEDKSQERDSVIVNGVPSLFYLYERFFNGRLFETAVTGDLSAYLDPLAVAAAVCCGIYVVSRESVISSPETIAEQIRVAEKDLEDMTQSYVDLQNFRNLARGRKKPDRFYQGKNIPR